VQTQDMSFLEGVSCVCVCRQLNTIRSYVLLVEILASIMNVCYYIKMLSSLEDGVLKFICDD
jgi:hypothetical protein